MLKRKQAKKARKKGKPGLPAKRHALWELAFGSPGAWKHGKAIYEELKTEKRKGEPGKKPKNASRPVQAAKPVAKTAKLSKAPKKKALRAA